MKWNRKWRGRGRREGRKRAGKRGTETGGRMRSTDTIKKKSATDVAFSLLNKCPLI